MEKLLLVGAGGFGRVVIEHASMLYECAFLDDGDTTVVDGIPVIENTNDMKRFYGEYESLLVTIGNNKQREWIYIRKPQASAIPFQTSYIRQHILVLMRILDRAV